MQVVIVVHLLAQLINDWDWMCTTHADSGCWLCVTPFRFVLDVVVYGWIELLRGEGLLKREQMAP